MDNSVLMTPARPTKRKAIECPGAPRKQRKVSPHPKTISQLNLLKFVNEEDDDLPFDLVFAVEAKLSISK